MTGETQPMDGCPTKIVADLPTDKDAFGAHQRLAEALARLVRSESGGRVVGLSGRWGSGKSTVVRLLDDQLSRDDRRAHRVWVFDTWAHEGDLLRQTFLEELVNFLGGHGWVDPAAWSDELDELSGRRQRKEERVSPNLSPFGWVAAASLLLVPVGVALFAHALDTGATLQFLGQPHWEAVLGLGMMLSPALIAVVLVCGLTVRAGWRALTNHESFSFPDLGVTLAPLVQGKVTNTYTETIQTPATSSIEFERAFSSIMNDALAPEDRQLVVVIDNLDRVAPTEALTIWSTLQTFLQPKTDVPAWLPRLWIMMPYDHSSIKRLWETGPESSQIASAFLDKTFQVEVDVPPPLLSDWRDYLLDLLQHVLPAHDAEEFHTIYRLFASNRGPEGLPPTPRELKLFVNRLGMLHMHRGHDVPLVHQAYYSLQRRSERDVRTALLNGALPREEDMGLLGEGASDSLAALEFGIDRDKARQLLLGDPLSDALGSGNHEVLGGLLQKHVGSEAVLEQVLARSLQDWRRGESSKVLNSLVALSQSGFLDSTSPHIRARSIEEIRHAAVRVETWTPLGDWQLPGLALLAKEVADRDTASQLATSYARSTGTQTPPVSEDETKERALAALSVARALREFVDDPFPGGIAFPGSMAQFCEALQTVAHQTGGDPGSDFSYLLVPVAEPNEVIQFFNESIQNGSFRLGHYRALRSVMHTGHELDAASLVNPLLNRISAGDTEDPEEANALIVALRHLRVPVGSEALQSLAANGHFAHHLGLAVTKEAWITVARCFLAHAAEFPDLTARGGAGQSAAGYNEMQKLLTAPPRQFVQHVSKLLVHYEHTELLFEILDHNGGAEPLVGGALSELARGEGGVDFLQPTDLLARWPALGPHVDVPTLLGSWPRARELVELTMDDAFSLDLVTLYGPLLATHRRLRTFPKWLVANIRALDESEWLHVIEGHDELKELATQLAERSFSLEVGNSLRTALCQHAVSLCNPGALLGLDVTWLVDLLEDGQRDVFRDELVGVVTPNEGLPRPFTEIFGKELAAAERLRTENSVVTGFFEPLVTSHDPNSLNWLADYAEVHPQFLSDFRDSHRKVFRKRVSEELRDASNGEAITHLRRLARALGIRKAGSRFLGGST